MRSPVSLVLITWSVSLAFWGMFGACVDTADDATRSPNQLIAMWDPYACGPPHRVVVELEDGSGARIDASAPCAVGRLQTGVPELGDYRGRAFAWDPDGPIRSIEPVSVAIDRSALTWVIPTPE